jgi:hypothetical protein
LEMSGLSSRWDADPGPVSSSTAKWDRVVLVGSVAKWIVRGRREH